MKTNRRKFFKMAGVSAMAIGSVQFMNPLTLIAKDDPDADSDFEIGIASYGLRELSLDQLIEAMKSFDLKKICLKSHHLALDSTDDEIRNVITRLKQADLDPYACGVVYMKTEEEVDRAFHYAKVAGFKIIVGVPNYELLDYVEEKVKHEDIIVAIHNHGPADLPYPAPEDIMSRIKGRDKRLGMCMDVAHVARLGIDPVKAIRESADRLYDVHLRDNTHPSEKGRCARPGKGSLNLPLILKTLLDVGYKGVYTIEYTLDKNNPVLGTAETAGYLRGIMNTLKLG